MPITIQQFVERLTQSSLMSVQEIDSFQEQLPPEKRPTDVQQLAQVLVRQGKLTKYQAQAVYQGKTKGLVFGQYTVLDQIGEGGMGVVLKAQHRRMKRLVAIKILSSVAMKQPGAVERFHREVEAAAKLSHPNIVAAHDADEHQGMHYLVMEYVEGQDLASIVKDRGPLGVREAVDCILQAARGLQFAHEQGIVHRDIKPGNLLLDKKGTVKILDMGLARIAGASAALGGPERLTTTGQVMGTCDYMSPEQALDAHDTDHRADIYALGCTLYRLLTGQPPYVGQSLMQILLAHREDPIPSLCEARPDAPAELDACFQKMVAKEPQDRQQSMAAVIAELEAVLTGLSGRSARPAAARPVSSGGAAAKFPESTRGGSQAATLTREKASVAGERTESRLSAEHDTSPNLLGKVREKVAKVRRKPLLLTGIAGGLILLLAAVMTFTLRHGTLVVEIDEKLGKDVQVAVSQGGQQVQIADAKSGWTLSLGAGKYDLTVNGGDDHFQLDSQSVTVTRGGQAKVKVALKPATPGRAKDVVAHSTATAPAADSKSQISNLKSENPSPLQAQQTFLRREPSRQGVGLALAAVTEGPELHVSIDGQERDLAEAKTKAQGGLWRLNVPAGRHAVRLWRKGFVPIGQDIEFADSETTVWTPPWQPAPEGGHGLIAEMYQGRNFDKFVKTRLVRQIECFPTEKAPDPQLPSTEFSIRWSGWIKPPVAGRYRFRMFADDRARVWIDGEPLTEMTNVWESEIDLDTQPHAIRVEFAQEGGRYFALLQWACSGVSTYQTIPPQSLFTDREAAEAASSDPGLLVRSDAAPRPAADGLIDLLKLADPIRDTVHGAWWFDDQGLVSSCSNPALLQIPFTPPAEYDLEVIAERQSGKDCLKVGLVAGGRQFAVALDGWDGAKSGIELVDGCRPDQVQTCSAQNVFAIGRPVTLNFEIRRSRLTLKRDGETIIDWPADYSRCDMLRDFAVPGEKFLSLGTWSSCFRIGRMTLRPVSREQQTFVDDNPKLLDAPRDLPLGEWVDLLPYVDTRRDEVESQWRRQDDGLHAGQRGWSRLILPVFIGGAYELETEFTRHDGQSDVALVLPAKHRQALLHLSGGGGNAGGISAIDGNMADRNPTGIRPSKLENGRRYTLRGVVTPQGDSVTIEATLDGKPFTRFSGKLASVMAPRAARLRDFGRPGLGSLNNRVTFHKARVRLLAGRGFLLAADRAQSDPWVFSPCYGPTDSDSAFIDEMAPAGGRLVGLRLTTAQHLIARIQPVFDDPSEQQGHAVANRPDDWSAGMVVTELKAKPGYAVGGVVCSPGAMFDGLRLVYFRKKGKLLDPNDRYESEWFGGRGSRDTVLGGSGQPVLGIRGDTKWNGGFLCNLGLILARAPAAAAEMPASDFISLTRLQPLHTLPGCSQPLARTRSSDDLIPHAENEPDLHDKRAGSTEYLFLWSAHAQLSYDIPSAATEFTATGKSESHLRAYRVFVDGQCVHASRMDHFATIHAPLPAGARRLDLIVDEPLDRDGDCYLCDPRFHVREPRGGPPRTSGSTDSAGKQARN